MLEIRIKKTVSHATFSNSYYDDIKIWNKSFLALKITYLDKIGICEREKDVKALKNVDMRYFLYDDK